jgi:hypothetical protein
MAKRQIFHSIKTMDGWVVKRDGGKVSTHGSQEACEAAAIQAGRKAYKDGGLGQAVLHKSDGTIREERTYGGDPEKTPG